MARHGRVLMFKRVLTVVIFVAAFAVAVVFTAMNPEVIELELGFALVEAPRGLAFIVALALGWVLGLLSLLPRVLRLANDRRRLRNEARKASGGALTVPDEHR